MSSGNSETGSFDSDAETDLFSRAQKRTANRLGICFTDIDWQAFNIRGGIPVESLDFLGSWGIGPNELLWVVGSESLAESPDSQLSALQVHRYLQLAWVASLAVEVFGNKDLAIRWLYKERSSPVSSRYIDALGEADGVEYLEHILIKIDSGYNL